MRGARLRCEDMNPKTFVELLRNSKSYMPLGTHPTDTPGKPRNHVLFLCVLRGELPFSG